MNLLTMFKYGLAIILLILAALSFSSGNAIIGVGALIAFCLFIYLNFFKPMLQKEPLNKKELIDKIIEAQDYDYKNSLGEENFELYADATHGNEEHKFVFVKKDDDNIPWYYPCTINVYTGKMGAMTGTKTDKISNIEFFLHGEKKPVPRAKLDQELIDELAEMNKEQIRDEINRQVGADARDSQERT